MTNQEFADSLRLIADFYAEHLDFPQPEDKISLYVIDRESLQAVIREFGDCQKRFNQDLLYVSRSFGRIRLEATVLKRFVCSSRVTGKRHVEEATIPAHDEDIVEWDCGPLLALVSSERRPPTEALNT